MKPAVVLMIATMLCLGTTALARKHKKAGSAGPANFDYYLLALSWAPNYCADHPTDKSPECRTGNHTAFVLHGLWPSANSGAQPLSCKPPSPVSSSVVRHMLEYFPSKGLIQHEWEKHGTCSGLSAQDYFARAEQAYKAVKIPDKYIKLDHSQEISVSEIEQDFSRANDAPQEAFRLSCHAGALVAMEACLDKDLHYQACPKSARECPADQVKLAPVR
jgi:ribonuclease T2